jgi:hypothetical protein
MTTFSELVSRTHAALTGKSGREVVSTETVQTILEEAGLAELMEQKATASKPSRLVVRQVWIKGQKWQPDQDNYDSFSYRQSLQPGLNGWVAGNGTGKSTVLKTIVWALTGVEPNFKPDVRSWLQDIGIEIELAGDDVYTIRYFPSSGQPEVTGGIFAYDLDSVLDSKGTLETVESFTGSKAMTRAVERFFCAQMGFYPLEWAKRKASYSIDVKPETVSWDVYSQALFVGADDYSNYLFPRSNVNGKHHQKTLSIYLGLDLLEAVSRLQLKRDLARNEYDFERKRVKVNADRVRERIEWTKEELGRVEDKIRHIDEGRSVLVDPAHVYQVREQVALCTDRVVVSTNRQQEWLREEQKVQTELNRAQRACQSLRESIQFKLFLSGLEVEKCPHCENRLPQTRVEEELETGECRVCGNELCPVTSVDEQNAMLKRTEEKANDLKKDRRRIRKEIKKVAAELETAQRDLEQYEIEFRDLSRQEREGFTTEMRNLIDRQGFLRGQLEQLQEQTEESQSQRLKELRNRQDVLHRALMQLQTGISQQHKDVLKTLENCTTDLAESFGVRNLEQAFFNKRFDMFVKQSGKTIRFQDMDVGERLRLKIAFHLTLLSLRVNEGIGRHPAFLVIDAPGGAEMDEQHFGAILKGFVDVRDRLGDQAQILIASTKEELVDICGADQVEHKLGNEAIF